MKTPMPVLVSGTLAAALVLAGGLWMTLRADSVRRAPRSRDSAPPAVASQGSTAGPWNWVGPGGAQAGAWAAPGVTPVPNSGPAPSQAQTGGGMPLPPWMPGAGAPGLGAGPTPIPGPPGGRAAPSGPPGQGFAPPSASVPAGPPGAGGPGQVMAGPAPWAAWTPETMGAPQALPAPAAPGSWPGGPPGWPAGPRSPIDPAAGVLDRLRQHVGLLASAAEDLDNAAAAVREKNPDQVRETLQSGARKLARVSDAWRELSGGTPSSSPGPASAGNAPLGAGLGAPATPTGKPPSPAERAALEESIRTGLRALRDPLTQLAEDGADVSELEELARACREAVNRGALREAALSLQAAVELTARLRPAEPAR